MRKEKNQNIIIGILGTLVLVVAILVILTMNGTISFANGDNSESKENVIGNNNENILDENNNDSMNQTEEKDKNNKTIEKYLGEWVLGFNNEDADYSNVNIKKFQEVKTGYVIDIFINKEADYKNLELHCADNSGVCYATGDDNHHFAVVMANEMITIVPDYSVQGTIWECGTRK